MQHRQNAELSVSAFQHFIVKMKKFKQTGLNQKFKYVLENTFTYTAGRRDS